MNFTKIITETVKSSEEAFKILNWENEIEANDDYSYLAILVDIVVRYHLGQSISTPTKEKVIQQYDKVGREYHKVGLEQAISQRFREQIKVTTLLNVN